MIQVWVKVEIRGKKGSRRVIQGRVVKEYDKFFLIETPNYRECINKASLASGTNRILATKARLVG